MKIVLIGRILMDRNEHTHCPGGNVLNVAKVLSQYILPSSICLISSIGNDEDGKEIQKLIYSLGIQFINIPTAFTPYIEYKEDKVCKVELYDIEKDFTAIALEPYYDEIKSAGIGLLDLHQVEMIKKIVTLNKNTKWILEPISKHLVHRVKEVASLFYLIKFNRFEAAEFTGLMKVNVSNFADVKREMRLKGVTRAFITLNKDGVFYFDSYDEGYQVAKIVTRKNFIAAGDAFTAGLIYCLRMSKDLFTLADQGLEKSAKFIIKELENNSY